MLSQDRWLLPEGIEEVLPDEARRIENLRRKVLDLFGTWGYRQVIPPFIEYIDSLLTGAGHDLDLQTFKLIDQMSGRLLGVRADMTPQVARIDARCLGGDFPSRLCYLGTVLHTQSDHLERSRSPMQVGAELYGHMGSASDLEIIRLMLETFAVCGIAHISLDLGHVGIYRELARQAGLVPQQEAELFEILQRKACPDLLDYLTACGVGTDQADMLSALVELNGGPDVIVEAKSRLASAGEIVMTALEEINSVANQLAKLFSGLSIHFDLAELRGYHYQTGMVFAVYVDGYGREVARGGRYNDIGKVFGRARPATGFSADLKVLSRLASAYCDEAQVESVFAPAIDDAALSDKIRELRAQGYCVIEQLPGQSGDANAMGCSHQLQFDDLEWKALSLT